MLNYLAAQDRKRAERVQEMIGSLTDREQSLMREAAVMGFVQGSQHGMYSKECDLFPSDSDVFRAVLVGCDGFADLYPTIATLGAIGDNATTCY